MTDKNLIVIKENIGDPNNGSVGSVQGYYSFTDENPSESVHDGVLNEFETIIRRPPNGIGPDQVTSFLILKRIH